MSRADRLEELATALGHAEDALMRAFVLSRDLGFADLATELSTLIAVLRNELTVKQTEGSETDETLT